MTLAEWFPFVDVMAIDFLSVLTWRLVFLIGILAMLGIRAYAR